MKTSGTLSIAAAGLLLAALMWAAPASARWDYADSGDEAISSDSGESIGTGSMSDTESSEPAVKPDDSSVISPDGADPGPNNQLGTGSMLPENENPADTGFSGQSVPIRPDIDLP